MSHGSFDWLRRLVSNIPMIGDVETDTEKEKLQHSFLVYMGEVVKI